MSRPAWRPQDAPAWMWVVVALGTLGAVRPLMMAVGLLASEVRGPVGDQAGLASGIGGVLLVAVLPPLLLWGLWAWQGHRWVFVLATAWMVLGLALISLAGLGPLP